MKALFFLVCLSILAACTSAQTPSFVIQPPPKAPPVAPEVHNEKLEAKVLAKLRTLPEVKEFLRDAKQDPGLLIQGEPKPGFKYYWVQLGIGMNDMFRSTINYCVDPKTLDVYYWDVFADDLGFSDSAIIPLSYWRQIRNTPGWDKRHTYKHGKLVVLPELPHYGKKTTTQKTTH